MDCKRGLILFRFIFLFVNILFFNSFFVSSLFEDLSLTGYSVSKDAEISFGISDSQKIFVLVNNFDGETTDFYSLGNFELEQIDDMLLDKFGYGRIIFDEEINLTKDTYSPTGTLYDRVVNIDSNLNISENLLSVRSPNLSSLNVSAKITFYGIDYPSPKILRNGVSCPESICSIVSHSGGTVVFQVLYLEHSALTTYSLSEVEVPYCGDGICNNGEICSSCPEDCGICPPDEDEEGGGSSGGGGGAIGGRNFTSPNETTKSILYVLPKSDLIDIEKGKLYPREVTVVNQGKTNLTVSVSSSQIISQFIRLGERSFVLRPGESRIYNFHVYASARNRAELYTGKITFTSGRISASVDLGIKVQELSTLFDTKTTTLKKYVLPGGLASAEIRALNIGDVPSVNVAIEYGIMDFNNIVYNSRVENVTIQKDIFVKKVALKVPEGIPMGRYVFYSKIIYEDKIAVSSDTFQLETVSVVMWIIVLILIGILILLIIFAIFFIKKRRKDEARRKREEEEKKALKLSKLSLNLPKTI